MTTSAGDDITANERLKWLKRQTLLWLVALLILAIAVIGVLFAFGVFTASSANPTNAFAAGVLQIDNNREGAAILTAGPMVPGDEKTGTVRIENTGNVAGHFSLQMESLTGDQSFADHLDLTVTQGDTTLFDGKLSAMENNPVQLNPNPWEPGASREFTFKVVFPSTGNDQDDNAFQGQQTQAAFLWSAVGGQ